MKTYIVSDTHIGQRHKNYTNINKFLKLVQQDANKLILCGDILELWRNSLRNIRNDETFSKTYNLLLDAADIVPTTFVRGNHDYTYKNKRMNVCDFYIKNNNYYSHGWKFDFLQRIGHPFFKFIIFKFPWFYQTFFDKPAKRSFRRYNESLARLYNEASTFGKLNNFDNVVIGHTHHGKIFKNIVDCGQFVSVNHSTYVIEENNSFVLKGF